jgi:TM2 domain-containing membrane protein YozV
MPAMTTEEKTIASSELIDVDLRDPGLAALLAWLWPGAGHLYQRRYAKGILFMVCVLGTYFFGLALSDGHAVYASWTKEDRRWQYICQIGVGVPAFPALVQNRIVRNGSEPLLGGVMAPPQPVIPDGRDELASWYEDLNTKFEMGTLYTVIAGLLNVLAIYDAYAGPFVTAVEEETDKPPPDDQRGKKKTKD